MYPRENHCPNPRIYLLILSGKGVAAQTLRTETGTPWTGARGVTLSVQELMDLQAQSAETNGPRIPREHEIELDRRNNPNSPLTDRWPVGAQERDAPGRR